MSSINRIDDLLEADMSGGGGGYIYPQSGFVSSVRRTVEVGVARLRRMLAAN